MLRALRRSWFLVLACTLLDGAPGVWAQDRFQRQTELLRTDGDLRVRTQAALALGASKNPAAVSPLCAGLNDDNYIVRMASALALSKLRLGGSQCLRERLAVENVSSVKLNIQSSLDRLEDVPAIDGSTRFYVAVTDTVHSTGRSDLPLIVRRSMRSEASRLGGFAIAPAGEKLDEAEIVLREHSGLAGFSLKPTLHLSYQGDRLSLKLNVAMLRYPENNLIGQFSRSLEVSGVSAPDPAAEDEFIAQVAAAAMKRFATVAPTL